MTKPVLLFLRTSFTIALALLVTTDLSAQTPQVSAEQRKKETAERYRANNKPVDGFRIIDNVYYVGTVSLGSYLISTPEGLILIDTGIDEMVPLIRANVEKLGFKLQDIKILLSTHAHHDHVGGHATMKTLTGAKVMALGEDAKSMEQGVDTSGVDGPGWTPVKVDRFLKDGDTVKLGGVTLQAHLTPGHTKGATSWTTTVHDGGKALTLILPGAVGITPRLKILGTPAEKEYAQSLKVLKGLHPDIFVCGHPVTCDLHEKAKRLKAGETPNPFIDPARYRRMLEEYEAGYQKQLAADRAAEKQ